MKEAPSLIERLRKSIFENNRDKSSKKTKTAKQRRQPKAGKGKKKSEITSKKCE